MKNTKINENDVKGFLLNFMAVVLGIVITFCGEGMIESRNEKKEVKKSLELVKNELKDNLKFVDLADSVIMDYYLSAKFLIQYIGRYNEAPADSMEIYSYAPLTVMEVSSSEEALDLLKTSSLFTKIKDQQLSLDIIHTYGAIRDKMSLFKLVFDLCDDNRSAAINDEVKKVLASDNVTTAQLWYAFTSTTEGVQFLRDMTRYYLYADSSELRELVDSTCIKIDAYK